MTRYHDLAEHLRGQIRSGLYQPGERLPSVRRLSGAQRVSTATVVAALRVLEREGWAEARPQSGFFACLPARLPPPAKQTCQQDGPCHVDMGALALELTRASGHPGRLSLGAAVPAPVMLPLRALKASLSRALRDDPEQGTAYCFPPGEDGLRVQIARRLNETGCALSADDVLITNGCQEAVSLALRAVAGPGDIVAIESPAFFGTLQAIASLGMQALEIPTDPVSGISLDALALALERWPVAAVLVVSNYSNPSGASLSDADKKRLVQMLAARDVPLIEDDVYGDLCHGRERPNVAKAYDREGRVLLCGSFSKTLAPGWRVGWIAGGRWQARLAHLKFVSTLAGATLPQRAMADYLASGQYDRHLNRVRPVYRETLARMQQAVLRYFPAGTATSRPQGGFVMWVEMPRQVDGVRLYHRAAAAGIDITPGVLASPKGKYGNCLRLAATTPWRPELDGALLTLGRLAHDLSAA
jgi:DNA-binding transcriptional MocR family regulator